MNAGINRSRSTRPFNTAARGGVGGTREGSGKAFSPRHSRHYSRSVYSSLPNSKPNGSVVVRIKIWSSIPVLYCLLP